MPCNACPRKCGAERTDNKNNGFCKMPDKFLLARAALHEWEEPCISGKNGSGTVFFSGCSLQCVFCQNYILSHEQFGKEVSDVQLMRIFDNLLEQGAHNINLVNPTHYAVRLAKVLKEYKSPVPVVYNSGGYERVETLKALEGLIDIYLPDLKYIDSEKSKRYSKAEDYFEFAAPAILEMQNQAGENVFDDDGMMKKGLIVRHLILPKNTNQSIKVLNWIHDNLPENTLVSLMCQYTPCGDLTDYPELQRRITRREYEKVVNVLMDLNLDGGFVQELSSAKKEYIPPFDFTGLDV